MKKVIIFNLYIVILIGVMSSVSIDFIPSSFIGLLKYPYIIFTLLLNLFYMRKNDHVLPLNNKIKIFLIVIVFMIIPGTLFSIEMDSSLFRTILSMIIVLLILSYIGIFSPSFILNKVYSILYFTGITVILITDFLLFIDHSVIYHLGNLRSFFVEANGFASLLGLFFIPSIYIKIHNRYILGLKNRINYIFFLNGVLLLILARSRSALMSFVILFSIVVYYKYFKWSLEKMKNFAFIFLFAFIAIIILNNEGIQTQVENYFIKYDSLKTRSNDLGSLNTRQELWNDRITGIQERPFFGWGFGVNSNDYINSSRKLQLSINEKGNTVLSIFEEFGVIFGSIIIYTIGFLVVGSKSDLNKISFKFNTVYMVSFGIMIAALIHVNFESWLLYFGNINSFLFLFLFISILSISSYKKT